jgi:FkbM family methyltransferase
MTTLVQTRYGRMECLDSDSIISKALILYGEWAQLELDIVANLVRPGDTVLDVGAFIGTHTLAFAKMVGKAGYVHSFEPRQAIRRLLLSNVDLNKLESVRVYDCALGSGNSEVNILALDTQTQQNFGGLAIEEVLASETVLTETILIRRLDDFTFERLDFIKIDAEGMEAEVIRGATQTLATHRPVLFAECNDLADGGLTLQICLDMNYTVFGALSEAFNIDNFKQRSENIFGLASEASLIAIPNENAAIVGQRLDLTKFARLDSVDGLSLLLLHKPQYAYEVLAATSAAEVLGIDFSSRLVFGLQSEVSALQSQIALLQAENSKLQTQISAQDESVEALQKIVAGLREQSGLWERLAGLRNPQSRT